MPFDCGDSMTSDGKRVLTVVIGTRVFTFRDDARDILDLRGSCAGSGLCSVTACT